MNPFLNLLDTIETEIKIKISLHPVKYVNVPEVDVLVNDIFVFSDLIKEKKIIQTSVQLEENIDLKIVSKNNNALVIKSIKIDDFEIIPDHINYSNYVGADGTDYGSSEYLGVSGKWNLSIKEPFYNWKHKTTGMGWLLHP